METTTTTTAVTAVAAAVVIATITERKRAKEWKNPEASVSISSETH